MQRKPHVHIERKPPLRPLYVVEKRSGALLRISVYRIRLYLVMLREVTK